MGTFDTFHFKRKCPECSERLEEWQTKQLMRILNDYKVGDWVVGVLRPNCRVECYAYCDNCDEMKYAWAIIKEGKFVNHIIPPRGEEVRGTV